MRQTGIRDGVDTRASTAGFVPDTIGIVLLVLVSAGVVGLGVSLGYPPLPLGGLCLVGVLTALGVRTALQDDNRKIVAGVGLLWTGALAFTGVTALLTSQPVPAVQQAGVLVPLCVAAAGLLGTFGIVGSTVRLYGHGAGRLVLRRYSQGTFVLVGIVALFLLGAAGTTVLTTLAPSGSDTLGVRFVTGVIVYALFLFLGSRASRAFPAAVFVPPDEFHRIDRTEQTIEQVYYYGKLALFIYVTVVFTAWPLVIISGRTQLEPLVRGFTRVTTVPLFVTLVGTAALVFAVIVLALWSIRNVSGMEEEAIAEVFVPPVVIVVLAGLASLLLPGQFSGQVETQFATVLAPQSPITEFFAARPLAGLLVLCALALLWCAIVLSVPSGLAGQFPVDESLAGVAASVLALTLLLVLGIFAEASFLVIVAGVAVAAVVWELGEYATVASGELRSRVPPHELPDGFTTLTSIHTLATLVIVVAGVALTAGAFTLVSGIALSTTVAVFIVIVTTVGIAALMFLLTG